MGKRAVSESAVCPYYCSETQQKIYCQGAGSNQWMHIAFQSKTDCRGHKQKYCRGAWDSCPYAALHGEGDMKYSKYGNQPIVINGRRYASQREAQRAQELQLLQRAGKISGLREQVKYELIPKQTAEGRVVKSCSYIADFVYTDANGETIVEDAKGFSTDVFNIKRKLMLYTHGIWVRTV